MSATGIDHTKCEQTIQQLRSVADKLAEALKVALETLPTLYHLAEWYPQCQAALAKYAEMKSDRLASSDGLPTDTGASQGGRE